MLFLEVSRDKMKGSNVFFPSVIGQTRVPLIKISML